MSRKIPRPVLHFRLPIWGEITPSTRRNRRPKPFGAEFQTNSQVRNGNFRNQRRLNYNNISISNKYSCFYRWLDGIGGRMPSHLVARPVLKIPVSRGFISGDFRYREMLKARKRPYGLPPVLRTGPGYPPTLQISIVRV